LVWMDRESIRAMLRIIIFPASRAALMAIFNVAAGRLDGFWEFGLNTWDIAAGCLLVQEAGGLVGDHHGGSTHLDTGDIVAANPKVFRLMLNAIHTVTNE